jgi:hypothetical protein
MADIMAEVNAAEIDETGIELVEESPEIDQYIIVRIRLIK